MAKLSARTCETAKPLPERDRLLGDGDGLFLRIRSNGSKTWAVEYEFKGRRQKYMIGTFDSRGASGESITAWLEFGRLSLSQARAIAGEGKADRKDFDARPHKRDVTLNIDEVAELWKALGDPARCTAEPLR